VSTKVTEVGMAIEIRDVQWKKAKSVMVFTEVGMVNEEKTQ